MCFVVPCRVTALLSATEIEIERLGQHMRISTLLLDESVAVGDWVAVQAQREAVARLSEDDAHDLLSLYDELTRHLEAISA